MSNVYDALIKVERNTEATKSPSLSWRGMTLEWKIMILVFGLLFVATLNHLVGHTVRAQIDERAVVMATNLSGTAAGYLASKDVLPLKTIVTKYARLGGVAYAFIKDREGKVIANSFASSSPEFERVLSSDQRRRASQRELTLEGKTIYETREPILEGRLGTAHVGISADMVEREIYQTLFLFLWPIALLLLFAAGTAFLLAHGLIPRFRRLLSVPHPLGASEQFEKIRDAYLPHLKDAQNVRETEDIEKEARTRITEIFDRAVRSRFDFEELSRSLKRMQASLKGRHVNRLTAPGVKEKGERDEVGTG
jgi:sensor histidine kinase regulating citrate/malate metabolism